MSSEEEIQQLIHELQVHQIELETQNEELLRIQVELAASQEHYFDFYNLAPLGYCTLSEKGLILEANLTFAMMLGVDRESLIQQRLSSHILTEDQDSYYLFRNQFLKTGAPCELELRMVKKNGTIFWVNLKATTNQDHVGTPICRLVLNDITGRRFREDLGELSIHLITPINTPEELLQRMSYLAASLQKWSGCEAIGIRLQNGDDFPYFETRGFPAAFVQAESSLCALTDGEILRDSEGKPILECMCGNILRGRFDPAKSFFTTKGSFWTNSTTALFARATEADRQMRIRNRCNREGYESVALIPFRTNGQIIGLLQFNDRRPNRFSLALIAHFERMAELLTIALSRRQTEILLRESEQQRLFEHIAANARLKSQADNLELRVEQRTRELQESQKQFLHMEKLSAIGKLSASIAHEFNNPLQGVLSILKGLKKRAILEEEDRELLEAAISESNRMKSLIHSLQDFNRPTSGRKSLLDIHTTLNSLLLLHKSDFKEKRIRVDLDYAERLTQILAVPDQITQVFLNLLSNATDACAKEGGVITVRTQRRGDRVAIAIMDNGVGIQHECIDLIFQPFYTTKLAVKGTGLGLSVSHGIVQRHKGKIVVDSRPGEGSTFTVLLPVSGPDQPE